MIRRQHAIRKTLVWLSLIGFCAVFGLGMLRDFPALVRTYLHRSDSAGTKSVPVAVKTIDSVWAMLGEVNKPRVLLDLRRLTGVDPICIDNTCSSITNRKTGSPGLQWAEEYVSSQLTGMGYAVQVQDWSSGGYSDHNFIVRKTGKLTPDEEIYFVAHMDGEICPAADDNASGVVSLLELARVVSHREFNETIVLLFTTGEEQGTLGAKSYVSQLTPEQLAAIQYVINVDMIGYDANKDGRMELFNGTQPVDFVEQLAGIITSYHLSLDPEIYSDCG